MKTALCIIKFSWNIFVKNSWKFMKLHEIKPPLYLIRTSLPTRMPTSWIKQVCFQPNYRLLNPASLQNITQLQNRHSFPCFSRNHVFILHMRIGYEGLNTPLGISIHVGPPQDLHRTVLCTCIRSMAINKPTRARTVVLHKFSFPCMDIHGTAF